MLAERAGSAIGVILRRVLFDEALGLTARQRSVLHDLLRRHLGDLEAPRALGPAEEECAGAALVL